MEGAKQCGRVVPCEGKDKPFEEAKAVLKDIESGLDAELQHWRDHLQDRKIDYWTPGGSTTTEPFQLQVAASRRVLVGACSVGRARWGLLGGACSSGLELALWWLPRVCSLCGGFPRVSTAAHSSPQVSEATLDKRGTPDEFTQMSSKKGTIRFWTDEIRELVAQHTEAKATQEAALKEVATRLFAAFTSHFTLWRGAVSCAAELDCLLSLAELSARDGMCRPEFVSSERAFLHVQQGVNMCVQATLASGTAIPNDLRLGAEGAEAEPSFLLVTGPNMGGKSTLLRQACLTVLMAHLGCWVAAESCRLSPSDRIFTRVGANDAIMAGLSTFRVELEETALILQHATQHSLVILDELGRGTATFDGMAIAHGVMQHIVHETRCLCLFATHYHALTREFERPNPLVALYHMACRVDDETRAVTFLYRFLRGACNRSHGVHVARLAGLPEPLLKQAEESSAQLEAVLEGKYALTLARRLLALSPDDVEQIQTLQAEAAASLRGA